jgi:hypothetical protein
MMYLREIAKAVTSVFYAGCILALVTAQSAAADRGEIEPSPVGLRALGDCKSLFEPMSSWPYTRGAILRQVISLPGDMSCKFRVTVRLRGRNQIQATRSAIRKIRVLRFQDSPVGIASQGSWEFDYVDVVLKGDSVLRGVAEFMIPSQQRSMVVVRRIRKPIIDPIRPRG